MLFDGAPLRVRNCRDCLDRGIGLVHQEIQVVAEASVAENIMLDKLDSSAAGDASIGRGWPTKRGRRWRGSGWTLIRKCPLAI